MAKREKGVGVYSGNDVKVRPDPRIDDSGNYRPGPGDRRQPGGAYGRQISNIDDDDNSGGKGSAPVTDAKFSGGAMSRGVSQPKVKRHGP
jgi:hypothetical protein